MLEAEFLTLEQAHRRYGKLRRLSYEEATRAAQAAGVPFATLTEIDAAALRMWREAWAERKHWTGEGGYRWDLLSRRYRSKPRAFHMAIWGSGVLCGMIVGWVSKAHERLTLHFMESSPDQHHPLRGSITFLAFAAAESYGRAVGARTVILRNPLPGVVARYVRLGYALARDGSSKLYYHKQLN